MLLGAAFDCGTFTHLLHVWSFLVARRKPLGLHLGFGFLSLQISGMGLTSWGLRCANKQLPTVSGYGDWLARLLRAADAAGDVDS